MLIWWQIQIQWPQKHDMTNFIKFETILNFENLMTDFDSATPKTSVRTISSSSEHFSKFGPLYWIRHFKFRKFGIGFGFSDPKNLCTATFTNIRWNLSEASTPLYSFRIFKWKITILKMITTLMMKTKSILFNYKVCVHRWLKKVWHCLTISMCNKTMTKSSYPFSKT